MPPLTQRLHTSVLLSGAGVRHGFTTRLGGVSVGRFASLNLGASWGDEPASVEENLRLVAADAGFAAPGLCQVRQVHGTSVVPLLAPERRQREADGMVTQAPLTLGVLSADCVSLLLTDGQGRVAAVHAGWRGTVADVAGQAVRALGQLGAAPRALLAAMGPSIGPCCFAVGADVAARFAQVVPESVRPGAGQPHVDLWTANRALLVRAGVLAQHIEADPACTACDARTYFSYRRDGARIGQHLAFITGGAT